MTFLPSARSTMPTGISSGSCRWYTRARICRARTRTRTVVTVALPSRLRAGGTATMVTLRTRLLSAAGATRCTSYPAATSETHSFSKIRVS